jgi:hypothetical protein
MSKYNILFIIVAITLVTGIQVYAQDKIIVTPDDNIIVCTTDENGVTVCL